MALASENAQLRPLQQTEVLVRQRLALVAGPGKRHRPRRSADIAAAPAASLIFLPPRHACGIS